MAECLLGIASILKMQGKFDETMECYAQTLEVMRDVHGNVHADVAKVLCEMSYMCELHVSSRSSLMYCILQWPFIRALLIRYEPDRCSPIYSYPST